MCGLLDTYALSHCFLCLPTSIHVPAVRPVDYSDPIIQLRDIVVIIR